MSVRFSFQEMIEELRAFSAIANRFISPGSKNVLPQFHRQLEGYRNANTLEPFDWEIPDGSPLTTIATKEYESGGGGQKLLVGQISAKWRVKKVPPDKKSKPAEYFSIAGLASTRVRLRCIGIDQEPSDQIAMWRMEIGDPKAPGCFFHSQILGETEDFPFPHSLPIPRLPIIVMTPASVAEFVFCELFQDHWGPHAARQIPHLNRWAPIQKERFTRLLNWKMEQLNNTSGSPWCSLKSAQPRDDLFVS